MLTVIVIIGILAGMITGAVIVVKAKARVTVIGIEISQLDAALKQYKLDHGSYPPDFAGLGGTPAERDIARRAVLRHLTTAFPRYRPGVPSGSLESDPWERLKDDIEQAGLPREFIDRLDPSSALVFWLGGLPEGPGSKRLIGFSANARNPFDSLANSASRVKRLFEFDPGRLRLDDDGVLRYYPDTGGGGENAPYVYFKASNGIYGFRAPDGSYIEHPGFTPADYGYPEWGSTRPCVDTRVDVPANTPPFDWANRDTFQIRCAGLDGVFGPGVRFPSGEDYSNYSIDDPTTLFDETTVTFDDMTNFSGGKLEDKM
jgi:hypothetical protein